MLNDRQHASAWMKLQRLLQPLLSTEDMAEAERIIGPDADLEAEDAVGAAYTAYRPASPRAGNYASDGHSPGATWQALEIAKNDVRAVLGDNVPPQSSAPAYYRLALDSMGISYAGVHPSAYPHLFRTARTHGARGPRSIGMDSRGRDSLNTRFGTDLTRIRQLG